jgi:hypothetical protein
MVDRAYQKKLPALENDLERLRGEFRQLNGPTNWNGLRVEPLLKHVRSLEQILGSREYSGEVSRLRTGVRMFHSDLVYLRTNVRELQRLLELERKRLRRERTTHRPAARS